jgi:excisionase family DNA binding protein
MSIALDGGVRRDEPLAVSPAVAARLAGLGRTTIYAALTAGELKSLKVGARRLILVETLRAWLVRHEVA